MLRDKLAVVGLLALLVGCSEPTPRNTADTAGSSEVDAKGIVQVGPGAISSAAREFATTISPDGNALYFNRLTENGDWHIWRATKGKGGWSSGEVEGFSKAGFADLDPFVSRSGDRLYFSSDRPIPGSGETTPTPDTNTWYAPREGDGWGEPVYAGALVNNTSSETFVSESADGKLIFTRFGEGRGRARPAYLMMAERDGEVFKNLQQITTFPVAGRFSNPAISPDGKLIIAAGGFGGRPPRLHYARLIDTSEGKQEWTKFHPVPDMHSAADSADFAPYIANDGKTLYFSSSRVSETGGDDDIYKMALPEAVLSDATPFYGPASGSLIIAGGADLSGTGIYERFLELGGGAENGVFVIVPTARGNFMESGDPQVFEAESILARWRLLGAKNLHMLHTHDPETANSDDFTDILSKATGVWFMGGRQWNIVDSYAGTKTYAAMHSVLERGGVIGGSSAGATIQGEYLVRGDTSGPNIVMTDEPNHQLGFEFLGRTAIDQHVDARDRWNDIIPVIKAQPHLLGFGISERTALEVSGDKVVIIGDGTVAVHDNKRESSEGAAPYIVLSAGDAFDMATRIETSDIE